MGRRTQANAVDRQRGEFKDYRQPLPVLTVPQVQWSACCPDEAACADLEDLLWHVRVDGIGKKTSQGFGRILEVTVGRAARDESVWGAGGDLRRAIPLAEAGDGRFALRLMPLRPPYWLGPFTLCAAEGRRTADVV